MILSAAEQKKLVAAHLKLAQAAAAKARATMPDTVELADLIQEATIGLIGAARRFDPMKGEDFASYAYSRCLGAAKDYVRGLDPISRDARRYQRKIRSTAHALELEPEGVSQEALAARMGVSLERFHALVLWGAPGGVSIGLDEPGVIPLMHSKDPSPEDQVERSQLLERLAGAISRLPHRLQGITLAWLDGWLMADIGVAIERTESRVCQLLQIAVEMIKDDIGPTSKE
jgi:RNA polymerase sigma factor (sigma-70 family)